MSHYLGRNPAVGTQRMLDSIESQFNGVLTTFDLRYGGVPTYPTLSASLIVSLGGVLQEPGEAYYVSSDQIVFATAPPIGTDCWILLYSEYGAAAGSGSSGGAVSVATGEPMGHEDRTDSAISFDNSTRTFTIEPASGISEFVVWTKGTKRTYSTAQTVQIGTTTGLYYIYFDAFGVLQYRTTYFVWDEDTPTAYVYWNATTSTGVFVADERHGIVLDWATHEYLHRTRGAVIANGFGISNYTTTGDGSADSHAQFDLANGTFFDEDLEVGITHSATPSAGTFTQVLQGNAELPVYYLSGSEGDWVKDTATEFACKQSATTLQYNSLSGSTWSTTAANDNRYVVSWVVATNEINAPIIVILGQDQYSAIGDAEAEVFGDLVLTNFPIFEFRPLWKIIFRTNSGYTNTPNAYIANVLDLREFSSIGVAGTIVNDHGLLSGLADDDHTQYLNTTVDRTGVTANISTTGNITGANLIATGQLQGPANFVIDPAAIGDNTGTVEIKGNLTVQGTQTTVNSTTVDLDHLSLGDNEVANFGDGNDLKIYHNATDSYFDTTTVGTKVFFRTSSSASLDTNALSILSDGKVGIGTNNPAGLLDVQGTGSQFIRSRTNDTSGIAVGILRAEYAGGGGGTNSNVELRAGDGYSYLVNTTSTPLLFGIGGSEKMRIDSSGNVGIGTVTPAYKLDVNGSIRGTQGRFDNGTASTPSYAFNGDEDTGIFRAASNALGFTAGGSEKLRITPSGSVGIGTATPVGKLHVQANASVSMILSCGDNTGTSNLYFGDSDGAFRGAVTYDHTDDAFIFSANGTFSEDMRIDSSGKVGIGTSSPSALLHIYGTTGSGGILIEDSNLGSASPELEIIGKRSDSNASPAFSGKLCLAGNRTDAAVGSGKNIGTVLFGGNHTNGSASNILYTASIGGISESTFSNSSTMPTGLAFYTGSTGRTSDTVNAKFGDERMRIDSSGNVGIGTSSPGYKLDVTGDIRTKRSGTNDGAIYFGVTGSNNNFIYGNSDVDVLTFTTNGSEKVRIDSSGKVGIGTSSPLSKFHVLYGNNTASDIRLTTFNDTNKDVLLRNNNSQFEIHTGTGGTPSAKVVVNSSGNVGVGTSSPGYKLDVEGGVSSVQFTTISNWNYSNVYIRRKASNIGVAKLISMMLDGDSASSTNLTSSLNIWGTYSGTPTTGSTSTGLNGAMNLGAPEAILFHTNGSERARITSGGNIRIFQSTSNDPSGSNIRGVVIGNGYISAANDSANAAIFGRRNTTGDTVLLRYHTTNVGSISVTASSTSYNTSSDYRLKENVVDLGGAIDRVKQLAPKRFNFIADADTTVDGFLAHEAQTVVPESVTGTHNEVDDDGNAVMQGIDQSKLVPLLTAALKEAITKIETLETEVGGLLDRITALEGG